MRLVFFFINTLVLQQPLLQLSALPPWASESDPGLWNFQSLVEKSFLLHTIIFRKSLHLVFNFNCPIKSLILTAWPDQAIRLLMFLAISWVVSCVVFCAAFFTGVVVIFDNICDFGVSFEATKSLTAVVAFWPTFCPAVRVTFKVVSTICFLLINFDKQSLSFEKIPEPPLWYFRLYPCFVIIIYLMRALRFCIHHKRWLFISEVRHKWRRFRFEHRCFQPFLKQTKISWQSLAESHGSVEPRWKNTRIRQQIIIENRSMG